MCPPTHPLSRSLSLALSSFLPHTLSPSLPPSFSLSLSLPLSPSSSKGWEERTDAAITHLLKTALAKDKDGAKDPSRGPSQLTRPADASKLKKHITLVADRLHKGLRPTRDKETAAVTAADVS